MRCERIALHCYAAVYEAEVSSLQVLSFLRIQWACTGSVVLSCTEDDKEVKVLTVRHDQYGELATRSFFGVESKQSSQKDTLFKYNNSMLRFIIFVNDDLKTEESYRSRLTCGTDATHLRVHHYKTFKQQCNRCGQEQAMYAAGVPFSIAMIRCSVARYVLGWWRTPSHSMR